MTTTTITWVSLRDAYPDDSTTVLVALDDTHGEPVWFAWTDGSDWFDASTGGQLSGVTHWAEMPAAPIARSNEADNMRQAESPAEARLGAA